MWFRVLVNWLDNKQSTENEYFVDKNDSMDEWSDKDKKRKNKYVCMSLRDDFGEAWKIWEK